MGINITTNELLLAKYLIMNVQGFNKLTANVSIHGDKYRVFRDSIGKILYLCFKLLL